MRVSGTRRQLLATLFLCLSVTLCLRGADQKATGSTRLQEDEKEACTTNLKLIYSAIQAYQEDHKDLPFWLSDLVPQYLPDATVFICPVCRRTGKTEAPPLADPKLACSYLFEFCPVPLGSIAPNAPDRTRREWKRRQMGLVGSVVPIVRCRHHNPFLNLAFDGKIYESPPTWEQALTNRVSITNLTAAVLFAAENEIKPAGSARFAARDPKAGPGMLDLTRHYNAAFGEQWLGAASPSFALLPKGIQKLAGVEFDVRGIVQLASKSLSDKNYPGQVKGILVKQKCRRLQFLQAAAGGEAEDGAQIGSYFIHYTGNPARLEVPIIMGKDVREWRASGREKPAPAGLVIAWTSEKSAADKQSQGERLFKSTWTNLAPDLEIDCVDFVSNMGNAAPFLIAITAE